MMAAPGSIIDFRLRRPFTSEPARISRSLLVCVRPRWPALAALANVALRLPHPMSQLSGRTTDPAPNRTVAAH